MQNAELSAKRDILLSKGLTSKIKELLESVLVGRSHMNMPRSIYQYSNVTPRFSV